MFSVHEFHGPTKGIEINIPSGKVMVMVIRGMVRRRPPAARRQVWTVRVRALHAPAPPAVCAW